MEKTCRTCRHNHFGTCTRIGEAIRAKQESTIEDKIDIEISNGELDDRLKQVFSEKTDLSIPEVVELMDDIAKVVRTIAQEAASKDTETSFIIRDDSFTCNKYE